ncbi:hypothetical protein BRC71_06265 [Halobacteriales archaeon QH_7_65_31]|nr:MAG: hypothetical protein BRC71_06265 [Halobacteriales archaeon QH_7_65_31]
MSDDVLEIRADSVEEADVGDIWIAGQPLGKMVARATERSKRFDGDLGDRPEHVDDDTQLWALVEQLAAEVSRLQEEIAPDTDGKDYAQLTRAEKVHEIQLAALEDAQSNPRRKSALTYREVKMLFGGKPSTGHCYDLMQLAGDRDGFGYETRDDQPNRLTASLEGLNDSKLIHALNNGGTSTEGF